MKSVRNWQIGRIVFHQNNVRLHISLHTWQKLVQLGWDVLPHQPHIHPVLQITTYSGPYGRISLMERTLILWKLVKIIWTVHCPERCQVLGEWNHEATSKMAKSSGTKWNICVWINSCYKYLKIVIDIRLKTAFVPIQ